MARSVYAFTCLALLLSAPQAHALQLTNRDTADHKIAVTEKAGTREIVVKPAEVVEDLCAAGCTMKMTDGEEYEFDGNEVVSIEEGLMFLDEPAEGGATAPGETGVQSDPPEVDPSEGPDGGEEKNP